MSIKNPFAADAGGEPKIKRNAFDLSRTNLFSTQFGRLTPCYLEEVLPGDSFEIDSSLAIQGLPTVFPLQTRCRVSVEFYYSRNRTVFDGHEDFIFKNKDIEQPWLRMNNERAKTMISTNSLGDLFGLPTTVGSDNEISYNVSLWSPFYFYGYVSSSADDSIAAFTSLVNSHSLIIPFSNFDNQVSKTSADTTFYGFTFSQPLTQRPTSDLSFVCSNSVSLSSSFFRLVAVDKNGESLGYVSTSCSSNNGILKFNLCDWSVLDSLTESDVYYLVCVYLGRSDNDFIRNNQFISDATRSVIVYPTSSFTVSVGKITDSTDDSVISSNPFIGNSPALKVNAIPFRMYEQICNYYYRNDKNNPYVLNGEVQYNEFIPTHAPGADDNVYDFHYRNWELDRFTSAQQTPQFGEAPLVGFTFTGADTAELVFADGDGRQYTAKVGVDGDRVVTIEDFSQDIPSANLRKLTQSIQSQYGLSINDLRVANSFQRFLENTMRRGLRYRNQLKSHLGVSVDYPDIDIPQYIGGYSGELSVGKITSTAQTSDAALGDFNGTLSGFINGRHKIHCYCPEHGYIIGIMSITPMPVYTQVCNKSLLKTSPFDYALLEFSKCGFTPVTFAEVCPLQTPSGGSVNDVFGYQKLYYEYMRSYDEAHGFFRTSMKDFVLQRLFSERPELVADFTQINPDQLTDVFVTRQINDAYNNADKFLCNFAVHCVAKRQIPMVGTPSLE